VDFEFYVEMDFKNTKLSLLPVDWEIERRKGKKPKFIT